MMRRASDEIKTLRRTIEQLAPKADAYDAIRQMQDMMPRRIFWIRAALALCILALAALPLFAHSWYDPACCGGNDCAPITALAVTAGPDGWHVRLKEGEHPMVTNGPIDAIVPYGKELRSQDGNFHACVRDQSSPSNVMAEPIICLYVPDVGSA